jgi:tetratricopeptide (TPR) repeat protein
MARDSAHPTVQTPEDPLLLLSVLYGFWVANFVAFDGDALRELAMQFHALAEKQGATIPLMIGNRLMGTSLLSTSEIARGRGHYDQAIALYDPAEHRPLAMRFGQDVAVAILSFRSLALWLLGYPDAALADTERALKDAREIGQAVTLMYALTHVAKTYFHRGDCAVANAQADELVALADEKGALLWKYAGMIDKGYVLAMTGKASNAIQIFTSAIAGHRSTGSRIWVPL